MQRGDDVAELQRRLGMLGFDPGRIDGIFGSTTASGAGRIPGERRPSVRRHRRSRVRRVARPPRGGGVGAPRASRRSESARPCATRRPRFPVAGWRSVKRAGSRCSYEACIERSSSRVPRWSCCNTPTDRPSRAGANAADAELYLDLALDDERCHGAYYAATGFESPGGKRLASMLDELVPPVLGQPRGVSVGMRLAVLRETRMPAAHYAIGPPLEAVSRLPDLALAVSRAITRWCQQPSTVR